MIPSQYSFSSAPLSSMIGSSEPDLIPETDNPHGGEIRAEDFLGSPLQGFYVGMMLGFLDEPVVGVESHLFSPALTIKRLSQLVPNQGRFVPLGGDWINTDIIWNFGDGSEPLVASSDEIVEHVYAEPGAYTVTAIRGVLEHSIHVQVWNTEATFNDVGGEIQVRITQPWAKWGTKGSARVVNGTGETLYLGPLTDQGGGVIGCDFTPTEEVDEMVLHIPSVGFVGSIT